MKAGRRNSVESEDESEYSEAQVAAVRRVENATDFYSVLGIQKDFSPDDLKKAYRKLALVLHPDKNQAPGASEAFKRVGKAFGILSDPEKRAKYDKFGSEDGGATPMAPNAEAAWEQFERFYGSNISPEEVFSLFFGNRARSKEGFEKSDTAKFFYQTAGDSTFMMDIQRLSPLVVMLFLAFVCSLFGDWYNQATWSSTASSLYSVRKNTTSTEYNIDYFVANTFDADYPTLKARIALEREVESHVLHNIKRSCTSDTAARDQKLAAAQRSFYPDQYQIYRLKTQEIKSCERLKRLKKNVKRVDPVIEKPINLNDVLRDASREEPLDNDDFSEDQSAATEANGGPAVRPDLDENGNEQTIVEVDVDVSDEEDKEPAF